MLREQLSSDELYIYLFSDDPEWVKESMQYENSQVIDWNHKEDSWQDMYLICYFRFRLQKSSIVDEQIYLLNKQTLFYGLCCLKKVTNISVSVVDEIVSELGKIGSIGLYPKTVELLLHSFLQDSKSNYSVLIRKAEVVNKKRINTIIMDRSFGLHGFAGKELKSFFVQTLIPWTELI